MFMNDICNRLSDRQSSSCCAENCSALAGGVEERTQGEQTMHLTVITLANIHKHKVFSRPGVRNVKTRFCHKIIIVCRVYTMHV